MLFHSNITKIITLVVILMSLNACSSAAFKADPIKVNAINSVAVVSVSVPAFVTEKADSGLLGGLTALVGLVKSASSGEEELGNGREVAKEVVEGFVATMSSSGRWQMTSPAQVAANSAIKGLVATYDQSRKDQTTSLEGTPAIVLAMDEDQNEFATKAAKALRVDGVMMIDIKSMEYFLYTGAAGTGQAKARGSAVFKLFDRNGTPVWVSGTVVETRASAAMVRGLLNPAAAPKLHRSIGQGFATNLLERYADNAGG